VGTGELIALFAIVIMVLLYFAEVQRRKIQERQRVQHEQTMERDKRLHDLKTKMVDEYVDRARKFIIDGPHSLARLGLEQLESDQRIREAIKEMSVRSGRDVWGRYEEHIRNIDLAEFFKYVREHKVDFNKTSIEEMVEGVRKLAER
jgi:hypothetical protein